MQTTINQDIDKYKDDFFKGLSLRETIWGGLAFIVGALIIAVSYFKLHIPITIGVFISMPISLLLGFNGFYQKNGMTFFELMKRKWYINSSKTLTIKVEDPRLDKIKSLEKQIELSKKKPKKKEKKHGKKEIEKI